MCAADNLWEIREYNKKKLKDVLHILDTSKPAKIYNTVVIHYVKKFYCDKTLDQIKYIWNNVHARNTQHALKYIFISQWNIRNEKKK